MSSLNTQELAKLNTLLGYLQSANFEIFLNETFPGLYPDDDILSLMKLMTSRKPGRNAQQCVQFGRFFKKLLETNFVTEIAKIFMEFFGLLRRMTHFTKNIFWATFGENWATFCSNIESTWQQLLAGLFNKTMPIIWQYTGRLLITWFVFKC